MSAQRIYSQLMSFQISLINFKYERTSVRNYEFLGIRERRSEGTRTRLPFRWPQEETEKMPLFSIGSRSVDTTITPTRKTRKVVNCSSSVQVHVEMLENLIPPDINTLT